MTNLFEIVLVIYWVIGTLLATIGPARGIICSVPSERPLMILYGLIYQAPQVSHFLLETAKESLSK